MEMVIADPDRDIMDHSGDLDNGLAHAIERNNSFVAAMSYAIKQFAAYVAGEYKQGVEWSHAHDRWNKSTGGSVHATFALLWQGLNTFALARSGSCTGCDKKEVIALGRRATKDLKKLSKTVPDYCLAKSLLLEAEYAAVIGKYTVAEEKYLHAVALAETQKNLFEIPIVKLATARYYIYDKKNISQGKTIMEDAIKCFENWGASAMANSLRTQIKSL